ncbi:hypothetical protein C8R44DRAFT_747718 [Mycena epipterygia]|nr:hypothetical protein C8R44DRAFT_747718 [Mycena epipterygia]
MAQPDHYQCAMPLRSTLLCAVLVRRPNREQVLAARPSRSRTSVSSPVVHCERVDAVVRITNKRAREWVSTVLGVSWGKEMYDGGMGRKFEVNTARVVAVAVVHCASASRTKDDWALVMIGGVILARAECADHWPRLGGVVVLVVPVVVQRNCRREERRSGPHAR